QVLPSEGGHRSPPPPYAPPTGAVNFAGRRVGGNWRPPFFKQGQRTVSVQSVQSSHSVVVHEVEDYEEEADEEPVDVGYVQATPG
ncbi:hypothetical protein FRC00_011448, partial [Tulasnella sp. 408]